MNINCYLIGTFCNCWMENNVSYPIFVYIHESSTYQFSYPWGQLILNIAPGPSVFPNFILRKSLEEIGQSYYRLI
jgi:hypothetical protein